MNTESESPATKKGYSSLSEGVHIAIGAALAILAITLLLHVTHTPP